MKPIRILVDSFADQHLTNAQMTNARDIIRRLQSEKFHVSIFYVDTPDPCVVERPNTRLIRLPRHRKTPKILKEFIFGRHDILFYLKASPASKSYLQLRNLWKDSRPVVGNIEGVCLASEFSKLPSKALRLWENTILRSDYLFSNSDSVKESLKEMYGLSSGVVPTGVDTRFFTPGEQPPTNPRVKVLFAGSLRKYKEPQTVLQAAAQFPEADFVIAGIGVLDGELRKRAQQEGLANVRFAGALSRTALLEEYRCADIFFYPSHWEGSPKVVMEAASCGLPVIVRDDYAPETVIDGKTGYLVASDQQLFARLAELLHRPDLRRAFGEAGRKHIAQFDWSWITQRWEKIFLDLVASGPSR
jgi:glycosyltransferase involved in cell wall biosynthesis